MSDHQSLRWQTLTEQEARAALEQIAGAFRRMNKWGLAKRAQSLADAMYPKDEIRPQPIVPRTNSG